MTQPYSSVVLSRLALQVRQYALDGEVGVPSPCVSVCRMDPHTEQCLGCLRTLEEIAAWSRMDDAGKRDVWALIEQRLETPA